MAPPVIRGVGGDENADSGVWRRGTKRGLTVWSPRWSLVGRAAPIVGSVLERRGVEGEGTLITSILVCRPAESSSEQPGTW